MKGLKPQRLSMLHRFVEHERAHTMVVSVLVYVPFEAPRKLFPATFQKEMKDSLKRVSKMEEAEREEFVHWAVPVFKLEKAFSKDKNAVVKKLRFHVGEDFRWMSNASTLCVRRKG